MDSRRPSHAMERTADRRSLHFRDDFHISNSSDARSRPPSLILFSLGLMTSLLIRCALLLVFVISTALGESTRPDDVEQVLLRLENEWAQVDVTQDKSVFQRILAPEFVSTSRS